MFDGRPSTETNIMQEGNLKTVSLGEGLISDDYILQEIQNMMADPVLKRKHRANVVTADRNLRKRATSTCKPVVKTVINPVTFIKRYLPRLKGFKGPNEIGVSTPSAAQQ